MSMIILLVELAGSVKGPGYWVACRSLAEGAKTPRPACTFDGFGTRLSAKDSSRKRASSAMSASPRISFEAVAFILIAMTLMILKASTEVGRAPTRMILAALACLLCTPGRIVNMADASPTHRHEEARSRATEGLLFAAALQCIFTLLVFSLVTCVRLHALVVARRKAEISVMRRLNERVTAAHQAAVEIVASRESEGVVEIVDKLHESADGAEATYVVMRHGAPGEEPLVYTTTYTHSGLPAAWVQLEETDSRSKSEHEFIVEYAEILAVAKVGPRLSSPGDAVSTASLIMVARSLVWRSALAASSSSAASTLRMAVRSALIVRAMTRGAVILRVRAARVSNRASSVTPARLASAIRRALPVVRRTARLTYARGCSNFAHARRYAVSSPGNLARGIRRARRLTTSTWTVGATRSVQLILRATAGATTAAGEGLRTLFDDAARVRSVAACFTWTLAAAVKRLLAPAFAGSTRVRRAVRYFLRLLACTGIAAHAHTDYQCARGRQGAAATWDVMRAVAALATLRIVLAAIASMPLKNMLARRCRATIGYWFACVLIRSFTMTFLAATFNTVRMSPRLKDLTWFPFSWAVANYTLIVLDATLIAAMALVAGEEPDVVACLYAKGAQGRLSRVGLTLGAMIAARAVRPISLPTTVRVRVGDIEKTHELGPHNELLVWLMSLKQPQRSGRFTGDYERGFLAKLCAARFPAIWSVVEPSYATWRPVGHPIDADIGYVLTGSRRLVPVEGPVTVEAYGTRGDFIPPTVYHRAFERYGFHAVFRPLVNPAEGLEHLAAIERGNPGPAISHIIDFSMKKNQPGIRVAPASALLRGPLSAVYGLDPAPGLTNPITLGHAFMDVIGGLTTGPSRGYDSVGTAWGLPRPVVTGFEWYRIVPFGIGVAEAVAASSSRTVLPKGLPKVRSGDHRWTMIGSRVIHCHGGVGTAASAVFAGASIKSHSKILDRDWLPGKEHSLDLVGCDADVIAAVAMLVPEFYANVERLPDPARHAVLACILRRFSEGCAVDIAEAAASMAVGAPGSFASFAADVGINPGVAGCIAISMIPRSFADVYHCCRVKRLTTDRYSLGSLAFGFMNPVVATIVNMLSPGRWVASIAACSVFDGWSLVGRRVIKHVPAWHVAFVTSDGVEIGVTEKDGLLTPYREAFRPDNHDFMIGLAHAPEGLEDEGVILGRYGPACNCTTYTFDRLSRYDFVARVLVALCAIDAGLMLAPAVLLSADAFRHVARNVRASAGPPTAADRRRAKKSFDEALKEAERLERASRAAPAGKARDELSKAVRRAKSTAARFEAILRDGVPRMDDDDDSKSDDDDVSRPTHAQGDANTWGGSRGSQNGREGRTAATKEPASAQSRIARLTPTTTPPGVQPHEHSPQRCFWIRAVMTDRAPTMLECRAHLDALIVGADRKRMLDPRGLFGKPVSCTRLATILADHDSGANWALRSWQHVGCDDCVLDCFCAFCTAVKHVPLPDVDLAICFASLMVCRRGIWKEVQASEIAPLARVYDARVIVANPNGPPTITGDAGKNGVEYLSLDTRGVYNSSHAHFVFGGPKTHDVRSVPDLWTAYRNIMGAVALRFDYFTRYAQDFVLLAATLSLPKDDQPRARAAWAPRPIRQGYDPSEGIFPLALTFQLVDDIGPDSARRLIAELGHREGQPALDPDIVARRPIRLARATDYTEGRRARALAAGAEEGSNYLEFASPQAIKESLERYSQDEEPERELVGLARTIDALEKLAPHVTDSNWLADPKVVAKALVWKYSCGFPFENQKATGADRGLIMRYRRDLRTTGWIENVYAAARQRIASGTFYSGHHHSFVKCYIEKTSKLEAGKPIRTVVSQNLVDYFSDMVTQYDQNKRLTADPYRSPWAIGMTMSAAGYNEKLASLPTRKVWAEVDATQFDSTMPRWLLQAIASYRARGFAAYGSERMRNLLEVQYDALRVGQIHELHTGETTEKKRGGSTGSASTTANNTLGMQIALRQAYAEVLGLDPANVYLTLTICNIGDDALLGWDGNEDVLDDMVAWLGVRGIALKVGKVGRSYVGMEFCRKKIYEASDFAADFASNGVEAPRYAIVHDYESVMMRQTALMHVSDDRYQYARTLGHILLTAHQPALYQFLRSEALLLARKIKADPVSRRMVARMKIPTYKAVFAKSYKRPSQLVKRYTTQQFYNMAQLATNRSVSAAFEVAAFVDSFGFRSLSGERLSSGTAGVLQLPTGALAEAIRCTGETPCRDRSGFVSRVGAGPFAAAIDVDREWSLLSVRTPAFTRDEATTVLAYAHGLIMAVNKGFAYSAKVPVFGVVPGFYLAYTNLLASLYGATSFLSYSSNGCGSVPLGALVPKNPNWLQTRIAAYLADLTAPIVIPASSVVGPVVRATAAGIEAAASHLLTIDEIEGPATAGGRNERSHFERLIEDEMAYLMPKRTVLLVAATGTGKTRHCPPLLARRYIKVIVLVPRRILAANTGYVQVTRGLDFPEGVSVATHGHYLARRVKDAKCAPSRDVLVIVDEAHDNSVETRALVHALVGHPHVVLSTATPDVITSVYGDEICMVRSPLPRPFPVRSEERLGQDPAAVTANVARVNPKVRILTIVPETSRAREIVSALRAQGLDAEVMSSGMDVPRSRIIVATQVVDAGVNIPDVGVVIDSGRQIYQHRGRLCSGPADAATNAQRAGRTGRFCAGVHILLQRPSASARMPYPTVDAFTQDPATYISTTDIEMPTAAADGTFWQLSLRRAAGLKADETKAVARYLLRHSTPADAYKYMTKEELMEGHGDLFEGSPRALEFVADVSKLRDFVNRRPFLLPNVRESQEWIHLLDGQLRPGLPDWSLRFLDDDVFPYVGENPVVMRGLPAQTAVHGKARRIADVCAEWARTRKGDVLMFQELEALKVQFARYDQSNEAFVEIITRVARALQAKVWVRIGDGVAAPVGSATSFMTPIACIEKSEEGFTMHAWSNANKGEYFVMRADEQEGFGDEETRSLQEGGAVRVQVADRQKHLSTGRLRFVDARSDGYRGLFYPAEALPDVDRFGFYGYVSFKDSCGWSAVAWALGCEKRGEGRASVSQLREAHPEIDISVVIVGSSNNEARDHRRHEDRRCALLVYDPETQHFSLVVAPCAEAGPWHVKATAVGTAAEKPGWMRVTKPKGCSWFVGSTNNVQAVQQFRDVAAALKEVDSSYEPHANFDDFGGQFQHFANTTLCCVRVYLPDKTVEYYPMTDRVLPRASLAGRFLVFRVGGREISLAWSVSPHTRTVIFGTLKSRLQVEEDERRPRLTVDNLRNRDGVELETDGTPPQERREEAPSETAESSIEPRSFYDGTEREGMQVYARIAISSWRNMLGLSRPWKADSKKEAEARRAYGVTTLGFSEVVKAKALAEPQYKKYRNGNVVDRPLLQVLSVDKRDSANALKRCLFYVGDEEAPQS